MQTLLQAQCTSLYKGTDIKASVFLVTKTAIQESS